MKRFPPALTALFLAVAASAGTLPPVQTVFVIVLENNDWADIEGSTNAPFINGTLLPVASHCEAYFNPPGIHPSEPNYLWLEAGTNFGILDDSDPAVNHQNTTNHLTTQLKAAGISWKTYQEDISGDTVPLTATNDYLPRHNPFVFFDDLTGTNNPQDAYGVAHNRPLTELAADLANNTMPRYNFITPNVCHDGHDICSPELNTIRQTDDWLASAIPAMLGSAAYSNNGAIFIVWDEGEGNDGPIGLLLLSPLARGGGYASIVPYTHSSLLRTLQEIFHVSPWLGDAANAEDLSDLFPQFSIQAAGWPTNGIFRMTVSTVTPGLTNFLEASTNLSTWQSISTNYSSSNSFPAQDNAAANYSKRFYRVRQAP